MTRILLALAVAGVGASGNQDGRKGVIVVSVEAMPSAAPAKEVLITARAIQSSARRVAQVRPRRAESVTLVLEPGVWEVSAASPRAWAPAEIVSVAEGTRTSVQFRLWPTVTVRGSVSIDRREALPGETTVLFEASPEGGTGKRVPRGVVACPLRGGAWSCEIPAGRLDLRIGLEGTAPHYRWSLDAPPGETLEIGHLKFVTGGSVAGFVQEPDGKPASRRSRVDLQTADGKQLLVEGHAEQHPFHSQTDERGFFQIVRVPPGQYEVVATAPPRSRAIATVEVPEGAETRLTNPLLLGEPVVLDLTVDPPLDPWGRGWTLALLDVSVTPAVEALERSIPADGHLVVPVPAADYILTIQRDRSERWFSEAVRLDVGSAPIQISLPLLRVHGKVTLGGKPLAATLAFGGRQATVSIPVPTGDDGSFQATLPRAEAWSVDVTAENPPVQRRLRRVEVMEAPDGSEGYVHIALPLTVVKGSVLTDAGEPPRKALVNIQPFGPDSTERMVQVGTEADGRFELVGLPEGPVLLSAVAPDAHESDLLQVVVGKKPAPVLLVLRRLLKAQGIVLTADGRPVPGALVSVASVQRLLMGNAGPVISDAEGRFTAVLPRDTREVDVLAGAEGHGLVMMRRAFSPNEPLTLTLDPRSGTLVIDFDAPWTIDDLTPPMIAIGSGGARERLTDLIRQWAVPNGVIPEPLPSPTRIVLPRMAPREYQACPTTVQALQFDSALPGQGCAKGLLAPDGELTLRVRVRRD